MPRMIAERLLQLAVVFVVVTFFTALLISAVPGDPAVVTIPFDDAEETQRTAFREDNDLDRSVPVRWASWAGRFVTGDFGDYYGSTGSRPVAPELASALPVSLLLMLYSQVFALLVAIPLGIWAAYRAGGWVDKILTTGAFGLLAIPNFCIALVLSYWLGVRLGWLPTQGYTRITENVGEHFKSMVIPVLALSAGQIAVYLRLLRTDLVATLQEDFILMARSKGVSNRKVLLKHALRPSSISLLTVAGLNVGTLIGGALVVEFLLNIPGMGYLIGFAVQARQYVVLQSAVALIAIGFVTLNFLIDILYRVVDPRIRETG